MNYFNSQEYNIIPTDTYKIIHNCPRCNKKTTYHNTKKFRLNSNEKHIDVWLIYQCDICKYTYNLPIYSRVNKDKIDKLEFNSLQQNDEKIAINYGLNKNLFIKNHLCIDSHINYLIIPLNTTNNENNIKFNNPYHIKIRLDKLISQCLNISRSQSKNMIDNEIILLEKFTNNEIIISYHPEKDLIPITV